VSADDLRPPGRDILDIARRARTPSDGDRDRVYRSLLASLGGAAAVGSVKVATAAANVAAKTSLAWLKWAIPVALVSSAGIGTYAWVAHRHVAATPAAHAVPPEPSQSTASELVPLAEPAPSSETVTPTPTSTPKAQTRPAKPQAATPPTGDELGQELSLLHQALAEWRSGNAQRALDLAHEHARRYPSSQLRFERIALEVRALCAVGREPEARKTADQLRSQAPNSPMSAALKDTCVGK